MEDKDSLFASVVTILVVVSLQALLIEYSWNYSIAEMFSLPKMSYWQAFMLKVLLSNLFERISND